MKYQVSQLLKSTVGATREYEIEPGVVEGEATIRHGPGRVKLTRTQRGLLAGVKIDVTTDGICSRCLDPFECSLSLTFEEEFFPTIDVNTGAPAVIEDQSAFRIDEHHVLDLNEAVRQYTIVALPMQPVCREDCAGWCPVCGKRRDSEPCSCESPAADPRLAPLAALLREEKR